MRRRRQTPIPERKDGQCGVDNQNGILTTVYDYCHRISPCIMGTTGALHASRSLVADGETASLRTPMERIWETVGWVVPKWLDCAPQNTALCRKIHTVCPRGYRPRISIPATTGGT
jgi:hypothetical protein